MHGHKKGCELKLLIISNLNFKCCDSTKKNKAKKKMYYHQQNDMLMFHNFVILRFEEKRMIVNKIHIKIGHLSE
jgi:hypothetical protein